MRILEASAHHFQEKGYTATSINDITESVGLLKGSIYYYIATKQDLLYEVIDQVHRETWGRGWERIAGMDGDALQKIRLFVAHHRTHNAENDVLMSVYFNEFHCLTDERRHTVVDHRDRYEQFLRDLIRDGQQQQVIRDDIDPRVASIMILGMLNSTFQQSTSATGSIPFHELEETQSDLIVAGLRR